jgi:hypothetical protein
MSRDPREPFRDAGSLALKQAVNQLRDRLSAVDAMAAEAFDVAMECDNGQGGVLPGSEPRVIDFAEGLANELFALEQDVKAAYSAVDQIVRDGCDSLPEAKDE